MSEYKLGIIGLGSMATAICDGLIARGAVKPENITASARNQARLAAKCAERGIKAASSAEAAAISDIVLIGVVPEQVPNAIEEIKSELSGKIIVSIAYGISTEDYAEILPEGCNVICTIPNTPVAIGEGIFVCSSDHTLTDEQLAVFEEVFGSIALLEYVQPELVDLGGIVAGSTPAFESIITEALADAAVKWGMPRASAYRLLLQMMKGTAAYALESGAHVATLKDGVCSPGGATIRGVAELEHQGIRSTMISAIDAIMEE